MTEEFLAKRNSADASFPQYVEAGPSWTPPRRSAKWKSIMRQLLCFDLHLLFSVPLFLIILILLAVEGCLYLLVRLAGRFVEKWSNPLPIRRLLRKARACKDFQTYERCALKLDELTERDAWKFSYDSEVNTAQYDPDLVIRKTEELKRLREIVQSEMFEFSESFQSANVMSTKNRPFVRQSSANQPKAKNRAKSSLSHQSGFSNGSTCCSPLVIQALVQCLKSCLDTQLLNTLDPCLYSMTYSGTKFLNEAFQEEVVRTIDFLTQYVRENADNMKANHDVFTTIKRLPKDFGFSALVLSGGGMLGLHHLGVVQCLVKSRMLPKIVSGTSAGSIIAAFVCTRTDQEILEFIEDHEAMRILTDPFDPDNWIVRIWVVLKHGYSMDIKSWLRKSEQFFGHVTFLEAFKKTGRILNISLSRAGGVKETIVLNYQNAPNVLLYSAVIASSAFPYLGYPLHLIEKDPQSGGIVTSIAYSHRFFHDGSLRGDVPVAALKNCWGAKFVVVSQVNPHVFPFLELRTHGTPGQPVRGWGSSTVWRGGFPLAVFEVALKEHLRFLLRVLALLEVAPIINGIDMTHVALQDYGGDLNIYPSRFYWQHLYLFNNVPVRLLDWFIDIGRHMAFPKLWLLRARMGTENALQQLAIEVAAIATTNRLSMDKSPRPKIFGL